MRYVFYILFFIFPLEVLAQQPPFNKSYEISGVIDAFGNTIFDNNNYYTCGVISYGTTGKYFLIELDTNGDTIRTKIYGTSNEKYSIAFHSLIKDDSTFIFAGEINDTSGYYPFVSKLNMNFDTIWTSKKWNLENGDFLGGVRKARSGYVFAGMHDSTINNFDILVVKCDTAGNLEWKKKISTPEFEYAYSIDTTIDGGYIIAGWQNNAISWNSSWDIYVTKLDSLGNIQPGWPKIFGTINSEAGWAQTLKDGSYIVWGGWQSGSGNEKAHLRKLLPNGNPAWVKDFQNPGASTIIDVFTDCIETSEGDLVLTGMFYDSTINNPVGWMLRTDSLGNEKWRRKLQNRNNDNYLYSIAQTPDGGFVMSGNVFPDGGSTTQDGWIIKVDSMGCLTPGCAVEVEELKVEGLMLNVYPNPGDGKFLVEILNSKATVRSEMQITVTDIFGRFIFSEEINTTATKFEIDISNSEKGIYLFHLKADGLHYTSKIIKK